ncbi:WcaF family extracellular polysaccharide biosynthesis acetyltransferase [Mesorhizobium sp.]|uniref:WcaF family extracellular polysaccharide biosynthesis acetyltransferase n=1 Tax=Mesorhizobium sp. TaxID=1871066 RepID=UPI0025803FF3|nr:WcaF family extracellular polysaccharide biosynthesis acetyltransferase [Mesorhizobium sp.]
MAIRLQDFGNAEFARGRSLPIEVLWTLLSALFVSSWLPGSAHRRFLLRLFGANIGDGVVIKPGVRVKFPWRLTVGTDTWIGEEVWIDNLATVFIGDNCCLSQGAYLCTGSHDWNSPTFDLKTRKIQVDNGAWIAAKAVVGPGVTVGEGAVLTICSVATSNLAAWTIYRGNPALVVASRELRQIA